MAEKIKVELVDLSYNNTDKITSILKGTFGVIPYIGPVAQELLGVFIPNQRMERVVKFVELLSADLMRLEEKVGSLSERIFETQYSSLFYKSCVGSADSLSGERIEYIKNIFVNGLKQTDSEIYKSEALLNLLNRVTDIELVYLRLYYLFQVDMQRAKEYQESIGLSVLTPIIRGGMTRDELENEVAKAMYLNNLVSCGLIEIKDEKQGKPTYKCSRVGDFLIRTIDQEKHE